MISDPEAQSSADADSRPALNGPSADRASAAQPRRISLAQIFKLIRSDIAHRCRYEHKPTTWKVGLRMMRHPGVACVVSYRLQCFFYSQKWLIPLGWILKSLNHILYGVIIDHRARIGGGLLVSHAVTVLITADVTLGQRCVLLHQNTIALSPFLKPSGVAGRLIVGNDVTFGGGSCAFGNIVIGDGSRIGVNAVVNRSCPPGSSLFGVPAQVIGRADP